MREVAVLGTGTSLLDIFSQAVARDARGRFILPALGMATMVIYDSGGREVGTFGRQGRGPGEFENVVRIDAARGDSLYLWDMSRRLTIADPSGRYVRSVDGVPVPEGAVMLPDGGFVIERSRGYLTRFDANHAQSARYRITPNAVDTTSRCRRCNRRNLRPARTIGHAWAFLRNRYYIERLDLNGAVLNRLTRRADWFPAVDRDIPDEDPAPRFSSLYEDHAGRLWVFIAVPEGKLATSRAVQLRTPEDYERRWATVVEVVDPRSGALITSQRFPQMIHALSGGGAFTMDELPDGRVVYRIWELRLGR